MGVRFDVCLLDAAAHAEDFRDAGDALEARADGPVGEGADIACWGEVVAGADADEEDLAHEGGGGSEEGFDARGKCAAGGGEAFLDEETCLVDIRAPAEFCVDEREGDVGVGAQSGEAGDTEVGALDGLGDVDFDFLGSEARGFCEDDGGGFGEVWQDFDGELEGALEAECEDRERDE
jgi:hypothetical protein